MVIDLRRCPPPPEPEKKPRDPFPVKLFILAILMTGGFYFFLVFLMPARPAEDASTAARVVGTLGQLIQAQPTMFAGVFLGLLTPPLAFRRGAKSYFLHLLLTVLVLWGACFLIASKPAAKAGEVMRSVLEQERSFPETIHGRPQRAQD